MYLTLDKIKNIINNVRDLDSDDIDICSCETDFDGMYTEGHDRACDTILEKLTQAAIDANSYHDVEKYYEDE
jgi:hypothetical protein